MATRIKLRRDTATRWQNINPVLSLGEPGVETDTGKMKIGDGNKTWNLLDYFAGDAGGAADTGSWTFDTVTATTDGNIIVKAGSGADAWASLLSNNGANSFWVDDVGAHVTSNFVEGETTENYWTFGTDGTLTFPDGTTNSGKTVITDGVYDIQSIGNTLIQTSANIQAKTWTFDTDGDLTLPNGMSIDSYGTLGVNAVVSIGGDDTRITIDNDGAPPGFTITTNATAGMGQRQWRFGPDGDLTFPDGSIQTTAYTGSGTSGDANVWVQTFVSEDGAPTDIVSVANSVEYDSSGNVIALFSHFNDNDSSRYYSVGKYTTTGTKIWTARFADGFETDGWGLAVAGNYIYVAGKTLTSDESGYDVSTLTKLDGSDGTIEWSKVYDFGYASSSNVVDVASDGNPVMVGYASNGTDNYVTTTKVDAADGDIIWSRALNDQGGEEAYGMAVGPDGEVVAIGWMGQLGEAGDTDNHMLVVKYASNGTIAWQKAILFDAGFDCRGADADIDSDGNIYVTGSYQYNSGEQFGITSALSILKLDDSGIKQWSRRITGTCDTFGVSVVVGADDKLYLSGVTAFAGYTGGDPDTNNGFTWVAAKYGFDGTVEWQRLIDHTDSWTFTGDLFFGDGGCSNLAVKDGYVVFGGGFGNLADGEPQATVVQVADTGDTFSTGAWAFTAASFSGSLNSSASDITVTNALKTDTDNASNISVATVTPEVDISAFLIGTLFTAPGGDNSLVNGAYTVTLENTGAVTLPAGGTITEGYVTSNPTIQLTPASPDVASQKLVIKGGGSYNYTDNGININYYNNTALVGDTLTFYISSPTYADQTLYWWIYPEGAGIATPESGTVVLDGSGGTISFELDSDDYEFTVRVSPEANNYDPASLGVETGLINPDAPTFDSDYHLHLTTGDLTETSIFLGTDNHNVRTTVNGGIEITTPNETNNVWRFDNAGTTTFPTLTVKRGDDPFATITGQTLLFGDSTQEAIISTPNGTVANNSSQRLVINPGEGYGTGEGGDIYLWAGRGGDTSGSGGDIKIRGGVGGANTGGGTGGDGGYIRVEAGDAPGTGGNAGYVEITGGSGPVTGGNVTITSGNGGTTDGKVRISTPDYNWDFGADGKLILPKASKVSEVTPATGVATSIIVIQSASSILNTSFVSLPPAPISNYNVPGTDIFVNVTWSPNGSEYHSPGFTVVTGGIGHTPGGQFGGGEVLTVPYADMGITDAGNWTWYVANIASNLVLEAGTKDWTFAADGSLTFPDATVQTTALVQGEQVFTLDTGAIDYAPTAVDFNLLFVTAAIGYSGTDPTSVTLPAGVPGQRLVIFNGYNLATLTVNPGVFGRDISAGVVAEFIYSGFDGLWMPLYGTNSPT